MTKIRLPHVNQFRDRHGKIRRYLRQPGCKAVPLPGLAGSAEFMAAYQAALSGTGGTPQADRRSAHYRRDCAGTCRGLSGLLAGLHFAI